MFACLETVRGVFFDITLSDGRFFSGERDRLGCSVRRLAGCISSHSVWLNANGTYGLQPNQG